MITIELPWPEQVLWPNRSHGAHWSASAKAIASAREAAHIMTRMQMPPGHAQRIDYCRAELRVTFCAPTARRYDISNSLTALKGNFDGIADALGIDDYFFSPITLCRGHVFKGGRVIVEIDLHDD